MKRPSKEIDRDRSEIAQYKMKLLTKPLLCYLKHKWIWKIWKGKVYTQCERCGRLVGLRVSELLEMKIEEVQAQIVKEMDRMVKRFDD